MSSQILSPRVAALAIVGLVLAGVAGLVGTDENEGALTGATQAWAEKARGASSEERAPASKMAPQPASSPASSQAPSAQAAPPAPPSAAGFAEDESLIDDASGFDPSPAFDNPAEGEVVAVVAEEVGASASDADPVVVEVQEP
ncbi:hypothetical protein ACFCW2_06425 [Qipengyuania sp. DSG2-2]|uniref:hypothetical protein n=1 Tax=Qipengyuania sp. DGS2-2 TaxID=3349631 RepID=UPI0036D3E8A7